MTDRGTSITLSYVLTLAIATVLVGGLITAGSTFVQENREQVIRQELQVIGEHVASNIEQVDRYADAAEALERAAITQTFQTDVTGSTYNLELSDGNPPKLFLNSTNPAVSIDITLTTSNDIGDSTAGGGTVRVSCNPPDCDEIVIENA